MARNMAALLLTRPCPSTSGPGVCNNTEMPRLSVQTVRCTSLPWPEPLPPPCPSPRVLPPCPPALAQSVSYLPVRPGARGHAGPWLCASREWAGWSWTGGGWSSAAKGCLRPALALQPVEQEQNHRPGRGPRLRPTGGGSLPFCCSCWEPSDKSRNQLQLRPLGLSHLPRPWPWLSGWPLGRSRLQVGPSPFCLSLGPSAPPRWLRSLLVKPRGQTQPTVLVPQACAGQWSSVCLSWQSRVLEQGLWPSLLPPLRIHLVRLSQQVPGVSPLSACPPPPSRQPGL